MRSPQRLKPYLAKLLARILREGKVFILESEQFLVNYCIGILYPTTGITKPERTPNSSTYRLMDDFAGPATLRC